MSTTKIPQDWDIDVIDYWNASLSSYNKNHSGTDAVDSEQVTTEFLQSLPKKAVQDIKETVIIGEKTKKEVAQAVIQEAAQVVTQEAQVGKWSTVQGEATEEETYEEEPSKIGMSGGEEQLYEEEPYYTKEQDHAEEPYYTEEGYQGQRKKARYSYTASAPAPPIPAEQDDGLSNLMMAWYYAGYYTGLYQAGQRQ